MYATRPLEGDPVDRGQRGAATSILSQEHGLILRGLAILEVMVDHIEGGRAVPPEDALRLLEFFRRFADASHHAKEEEALFPALETAGLSRQGGPTAVMREEHDRGRRLLLSLTEELPEVGRSETARARFVASAGAYSQLLQNHIEKEETVLFRVASRLLDHGEEERIAKEFERHSREIMEPGEPERLRHTVEELAQAWLA